jgi:hypothetical protein
MPPKLIIIVMLALILVPASMIELANGEAVSVVIAQDSVSVNMNLVLQENLTAFPVLDVHIDLTNSTAVVQSFVLPMNTEIQRLVPSARLSGFELRAKSSNLTGIWRLEENYSIIVTGANLNSGSSIRSNLEFIAMNLRQSFQVGTTELNAIGPVFLLPALQAKALAYSNLQYYIDGSNPKNAVIPEQTTKEFWLLDFAWVSPVSTWTLNSDVLGRATSWTLDPPNSRYNLTLGLPSPEGAFLGKYIAIYSPSLMITVPANSWASGNTVYFDLPNPSEVIMPVIAVTSLIIGIGTFFVDRKLTGPSRGRRSRR